MNPIPPGGAPLRPPLPARAARAHRTTFFTAFFATIPTAIPTVLPTALSAALSTELPAAISAAFPAAAGMAAGMLLVWPAPGAGQTAPAEPAVPVLTPVIVQDSSTDVDDANVPTADEARRIIERTPGAVDLVPAARWRDSGADTIKSVLDYTPGVFAQPKWGGDTRLSIRGSGLSRYYHLRGIDLYQDGIPLTTADGSSDFSALDPTAWAYAEVYKGANALRYGAATLGGAINFVSPTGLDADRRGARVDAGSFGFRRAQAATGFANGDLDGYITGSSQRQDGFRDHSDGDAQRVSANLGWRLDADTETRFYLAGVRARQRLPGSVTREAALTQPRRAGASEQANDWQRNDDSVRIANRTTLRRGDTDYELGGWYSRADLDHPIYQYLDNRTDDFGAFARLTRAGTIAGRDNRLIAGANWQANRIDARNFVNDVARRGAPLSRTFDRARNLVVYAEDTWQAGDRLALIARLQALHAQRRRDDRYNGGAPADRGGDRSWNLYNPGIGFLWQGGDRGGDREDTGWQWFGNVSRSAEPPTFGDMQFAQRDDLARLRPQRATTVELGTRWRRGGVDWNVSIWRARLTGELQCVSSAFNICERTTNLDRTIHQGLEAGAQWVALRNVFTARGRAADSIRVQAAWTWNDFRFNHDRQWGNNRIPGAPPHHLRAEAVYRHPAGWYLGPDIEWVPQPYYVDNANSLATRAWFVTGLRAGRDFGTWSVHLEVRNLANRKYIASASVTDRANADSALFEPGTGRAVFAGLLARF